MQSVSVCHTALHHCRKYSRWSNRTYPFTFELFLPGCRGSWEEAGSRGSAGWSASWLEAAPPVAGPDDGEAALAFNVFWRLETWGKRKKRLSEQRYEMERKDNNRQSLDSVRSPYGALHRIYLKFECYGKYDKSSYNASLKLKLEIYLL